MQSHDSTVAHNSSAESVNTVEAPALVGTAISLPSSTHDNKGVCILASTTQTSDQANQGMMAESVHSTVAHDGSAESVDVQVPHITKVHAEDDHAGEVHAGEAPANPTGTQGDSSSRATTPERWYEEYTNRSVINNFGHIPAGHGELQSSLDVQHSIASSVTGSIHEDDDHSEFPLLPYKPTPGFQSQVHRNEFVIKPVAPPGRIKVREYPPPPNIAYEIAAEALARSPSPKEKKTKSPAFAFSVGDSGIAEDVSLRMQNDFKPSMSARRGPSREEAYENSLDFDQKPCEVPGSHDFYCAGEQRQDFIKGMEGKDLAWCRICETNHIPPGAPISLADRDTCGAYLPDWFPTTHLDRPWDRFTNMLNEYVKLGEILQGYDHYHHARPKWDKVYHEPSPGWRVLGRRGGWWKCRGDKDAPAMERKCYLCHGKVLGGGARRSGNTEEQFLEIVRKEKQDIEDFCSDFSKMVGYKDREIVEARWRREGVTL